MSWTEFLCSVQNAQVTTRDVALRDKNSIRLRHSHNTLLLLSFLSARDNYCAK